MKHPHLHTPSGHHAACSMLTGAALITLASHWLDHTVEAIAFCANGILAAYAADIEREWNEYFHGLDEDVESKL